jgi:hypothetical protein
MALLSKWLVIASELGMMSLAGCGTTTSERAVSGGLLGAAGGAAIGSVTGSAGKGAVIGGVAGAATGALTRPDQVCLDRNRYGDCVAWGRR